MTTDKQFMSACDKVFGTRTDIDCYTNRPSRKRIEVDDRYVLKIWVARVVRLDGTYHTVCVEAATMGGAYSQCAEFGEVLSVMRDRRVFPRKS